MNKIVSIVALLALGTSVLISGCSAPLDDNVVVNAPAPSSGARSASVPAIPATAEDRLEAMQISIGLLVSQYEASGTQAPEYLFEQSKSIETARHDLMDLEGQSAGIQMLIAQQAASGQVVSEAEIELARSIEQAQKDLLKKFDLAD
jgi:hypothetical protein